MTLITELSDTCEESIRFSVPLKFRRGSLREDEKKSLLSALQNLKGIALRTGRLDWSGQKILDFGCGVKFTQALLQYDIDVAAYVGMDVHKGIIDYLAEHVKRPNFHYYQVPFQNDMYNPDGLKLAADSQLPGDIKTYDLITLQSVFTHFAPHDFQAMLHVLRHYAADDARLLFTCFIDNDMEQDFLDAVPDRPLLKAYYKEQAIRAMLEQSPWKPLSLNPPGYAMQHHFVCAPC